MPKTCSIFQQIYYEDQSKITKTIQKEETTWITFSISNSIADVSPEELEKLFDTTVSFNISDSKKRLGNRAKNDNPKVFYGSKINPDVDENEICFEQLFGTIEEVANTDSVITIKQMLEEQLLKAGIMGTVFNQLFALPVDQHRPRFREIVNKFKVEDKLPTKTPYTGRLTKEMTEEEPKKGKKKGKESTSKTSKKNKELSTVDLNLKMEAKQFFTG
ncbi:hypothetical protein C0J52_09401 [Blattella germanica]|nr:hypothetical protein C0J52_09401 [Blattella germanica]